MGLEHDRINVMKFGGTSMDDMDQVEQIGRQESADAHTVFVVSAFSGVTDRLIGVSEKLLQNKFSSQEEDALLFEPFVRETISRIQSAVALHPGTDFEAVEKFLREYIAKVLHFKRLYTQHLLFATEKERELSKGVFEDRVMSVGEIFSAHALATVLTARSEVKKVFADVDTHVIAGPREGSRYVEGVPLQLESVNVHPVKGADKVGLYRKIGDGLKNRILPLLEAGKVPVVPGYVGWVPGGIQHTIDRGYTDSTAAIVAAILDHSLGVQGTTVYLQIWKEVPGLFSGDPRLVEPGYNGKTFRTVDAFQRAILRRQVTFREAAELSAGAGMKAINSNGIFALDKTSVQLAVRNTFDPKDMGTKVIPNGPAAKGLEVDESLKGIRFVSGKKGQTMFTVESDRMVGQEGVAADILDQCRRLGVAVDAITTSATSLSFSVNTKDPNVDELHRILHTIGSVERQDNLAMVCCIGNKLRGEVGLLAKLSTLLSTEGINIEFDGGDKDSNVTFVIQEKDYDRAVKALHHNLFS